MKSVCLDCENRHRACWENCSKYLEAKAEHDKQIEERREALVMDHKINKVHYTGLKYERNRK